LENSSSLLLPLNAYSRDCTEIANEFNHFFTAVGKNAARQTQQLALDHELTPIVSANLTTEEHRISGVSFSFDCVTQEQVRKTIMNMATNKAPGYDKVSMSYQGVSPIHSTCYHGFI
jgi:hypothetical protein